MSSDSDTSVSDADDDRKRPRRADIEHAVLVYNDDRKIESTPSHRRYNSVIKRLQRIVDSTVRSPDDASTIWHGIYTGHVGRGSIVVVVGHRQSGKTTFINNFLYRRHRFYDPTPPFRPDPIRDFVAGGIVTLFTDNVECEPYLFREGVASLKRSGTTELNAATASSADEWVQVIDDAVKNILPVDLVSIIGSYLHAEWVFVVDDWYQPYVIDTLTGTASLLHHISDIPPGAVLHIGPGVTLNRRNILFDPRVLGRFSRIIIEAQLIIDLPHRLPCDTFVEVVHRCERKPDAVHYHRTYHVNRLSDTPSFNVIPPNY